MHLKHLPYQFRNFARLDIDLPRRVILLVGDNAQGSQHSRSVLFSRIVHVFQTNTTANGQLCGSEKFFGGCASCRGYERNKKRHKTRRARLDSRTTASTVNVFAKEVLLDGVKKQSMKIIGISTRSSSSANVGLIEDGPRTTAIFESRAGPNHPEYAGVLSDYNQALSQRTLARSSSFLCRDDRWLQSQSLIGC